MATRGKKTWYSHYRLMRELLTVIGRSRKLPRTVC